MPEADMRRLAGDVIAVEVNLASPYVHQPGDCAEQGALAAAVGPEDARHLAIAGLDRHAVENLHSSVTGDHVADYQARHSVSPPR